MLSYGFQNEIIAMKKMAEIMKEKLQAALKAASKNSKPVDEEELFRVRIIFFYFELLF